MLEYDYMKKDQTYPLENSLKGNKILSLRETKMLTLLAVGHTNREIAEKFDISLHTVTTHIYNIFQKINAPNRLQAALWAAKNL
jgi:DNA-binding CsgD family transcriptional regulator